MARRARRRSGARAVLAAVPLGIAGYLALHPCPAGDEAWTGPAGSRSSFSVATPDEDVDRRQLLQGAATAALAAWAAAPEEARAFRGDRISNAKKKYIPKIRKFYQKLEGLRDDIFLQIELKSGDASSRVQYESRPASWYDGLDSKMDGVIAFADDPDGYGCKEYASKFPGKVVFIKRGRCTFGDKMQYAKEAGAKSVVVYDQKISKQPIERQGLTGATRSKGQATRAAGDALSGGVSLIPVETGMTIMATESGQKPELDGLMLSLANGTEVQEAYEAGQAPRILDVKRFEFREGIDDFIKKDLKKMLAEMEIYSSSQRQDKDDMSDPVLKVLAKDRKDFEMGVRAKDYAAFRSAMQSWTSHLDALGKWELTETA